jgi:hypothetical protein
MTPVADRDDLRPHLDYMGALVRWRENLTRMTSLPP